MAHGPKCANNPWTSGSGANAAQDEAEAAYGIEWVLPSPPAYHTYAELPVIRPTPQLASGLASLLFIFFYFMRIILLLLAFFTSKLERIEYFGFGTKKKRRRSASGLVWSGLAADGRAARSATIRFALRFFCVLRLPRFLPRADSVREGKAMPEEEARIAMEFNFMYLFASAAEAWTSVPLVS